MVRGVCATVRMPMPAQVRDIPAELVLSVMESIRNVNVEAIMIGAVWRVSANRSSSMLVRVPAMPEVLERHVQANIRAVIVAPDMVGVMMTKYVQNVMQNISLTVRLVIMTQILPAVAVRLVAECINIVTVRKIMVGS